MKHGGNKDLIELVSLAQIDRELSTRAHWMIDRIKKSNKDGNEESSKNGKSSSIKQKLYGISKMMSSNILNNKSSTKQRMGGLNNITAKSHDGIHSIMKSINIRSLRKESTNDSMPSPLDGFDDQAQAISKEVQIQNIETARDNMKKRLPSFKMIYISPMHVRERKEELKNSSFLTPGSSRTRSKDSVALGTLNEDEDKEEEDGLVKDLFDKKEVKERNVFDSLVSSTESNLADDTSPPISYQNGKAKLVRRHSSVLRKGRTLHLFGSPSTNASSIEVEDDHVDMCFGGSYHYWKDDSQDGSVKDESKQHSCRSQADGSDGYATLMAFVDHLHAKQLYHEWKVTLAQQQIGSSPDGSQSAPTASSLLAKGKLHGPLLHHLIDKEIQIIMNLQLLTMPEESDVVEKVRSEYEEIVASQEDSGCMISASEVSSLADDFVGKAIKKNFDPIGGALCSKRKGRRGARGARIGKASRFVMLRQFGIDLRQGNIHLKPNEIIPAKHLEHLFYNAMGTANGGLDGWREDNGSSNNNGEVYNSKRHTVLEDTFNMHYRDDSNHGNSCSSDDYNHPIFASGLDQWQSLLCLAVSMKHPNATKRIWNCGLSDGGLHNMFLSEDNIWLFDLGEPSLEPIPAFLTKFLMSFFHTLGMEEDEKGDWVVRFEQDDSGKLQLTQQTKDILPRVMEAFNITMDRLINELFGGEEEVRLLLLRYVITQLISDAGFCIEKWRTKGGGDESRSDHQYYLEKWLWRALWDVYASEEIRRRYLAQMIMKTTRRRDTETRNLNSLDDLEE